VLCRVVHVHTWLHRILVFAFHSLLGQVMGHVLIRGCQMNVEALHSALNTTHCHRRMICVPIEVPPKFARYLKSAVSRSFGPGEDMERSGVDFSMRTIGRRAIEEIDIGDDKSASDADEDEVEDEETTETTAMGSTDPHIMSARQLKAVFKNDAAEVQAVLFQHSTRITPHAQFLEKSAQVKVCGA
jgi:hypothetical protein